MNFLLVVPILSLCVLSLVSGLLSGCASKAAGPAGDTAAPKKKGHWVYLAPETGSMIPRRVWVDDNGSAHSAPSEVQMGTSDAIERVQKTSTHAHAPGS